MFWAQHHPIMQCALDRLKPETHLTRAQIATRTCHWNAWTIFRSHFASRLAWLSRARRDLQAVELNIFQLSRFIANEMAAICRQLWVIVNLCYYIGDKEDARRYEKTPGEMGLLKVC